MPLSSKLFRGDAALEAASVRDSAHITPGAIGPHVRKLQTALNTVDGVGLAEDGVYGQKTANAVLIYKRQRDIVNRSYQTSADSIVGRMTIERLDADMCEEESSSNKKARIVPLRRSPGEGASASVPFTRWPSILVEDHTQAGEGGAPRRGGATLERPELVGHDDGRA
jgi:hypothetical protein